MGIAMREVIRLTRISSVPVLVVICALLYGCAFLVQRSTGILMIPRMLALSDTAQLYLLAAALCLILAISLALPFEFVSNLARTVATVTIDTLWFTSSALLVAASYVAAVESRPDVLGQLIPIVLVAFVGILVGGWIWSDLLKAKPGLLARVVLMIVLIAFAIGFVYELPLPRD